MMLFKHGCTGLLLILAVAVLGPRDADAVEIITNGGFESGDFSGWAIVSQTGSAGTFVVAGADAYSPFSGLPTAGPSHGTFYAVSDSIGPGAQVLFQDFTIPFGVLFDTSSIILSFDMFVNDWNSAGAIIDGSGLDFIAAPNQHARVDLLKGGGDALDTGSGVLQNFYLGVDDRSGGGGSPHEYTHYIADITSLVVEGEVYRLRFGEVDNQFFLNQGIDNVSVVISSKAIDEAGTIFLLAGGLLVLLIHSKMRRV